MGQQPALMLLPVQCGRMGHIFSRNAEQGQPRNDTARGNAHQDGIYLILETMTEQGAHQQSKRITEKEDGKHQGLHADIPAQLHREKAQEAQY